jgi:alpha-tubulin suppressor-like RCC1 family protein
LHDKSLLFLSFQSICCEFIFFQNAFRPNVPDRASIFVFLKEGLSMFPKVFKAIVLIFSACCFLAGGMAPTSAVKAYNCGTGDGDCIVIGGAPVVITDVISRTSTPFYPLNGGVDPFNLRPGGVNDGKTDLLSNATDIAVSPSACVSGVDDAGTTMFKCNQIVDVVFARKNGQDWHLLTEPVASKPLVGVYTSWLMSPAGQTIVKNAGYENVAPTLANGGISAVPGKLVVWGANDKGQGSLPAGIANEKSFIAVASGNKYNLALSQAGDVYAWGDNSKGQLGLGSADNAGWISNDALGGQFGNILAIATGGDHSLAIMGIGDQTALYAWGDNTSGQLGDGTTTSSNRPVRVTVQGLDTTNVKAIAAGAMHSLALTQDGHIISWGDATNAVPAAFTHENYTESFTAIAASKMVSMALKADGTVATWGDQGDAVPAAVNSGAKVVAIATGGNHFLVLKADGSMVAWGEDLGVVPVLSQVTAIATGEINGLALKSDGNLVDWREGTVADVVINPIDPNVKGVTAIAGGFDHNLAIIQPVQIPAWDVNGDGITDIGDVASIGIHWGETGASGWIPEDINKDGVIDIGDVAVAGLHWSETW